MPLASFSLPPAPPTHLATFPTARPQRLTGEAQPVRGGTAFHPSFAKLRSCRGEAGAV